MKKLYLAGGLFNAGQQMHNLYLEKYLTELGYKIILPQREALKFSAGKQFDLRAVGADCQRYAADTETVCVVNADGPDADSGGAVEYGIAVTKKGSAVVYRTDIRTTSENGSGINIMLQLKGSIIVRFPALLRELDEIPAYYCALAQKIHEAIELLDM
ncbi:MAG: Uroporphyrinogen III synthase HEM4 [Parcubacteria group bacterium Gr01-1014_70]|nr:MAG: Uroporphyrinogen III synthase HEM4 [Parcubacteria group bacterium Gr01-1014_70]